MNNSRNLRIIMQIPIFRVVPGYFHPSNELIRITAAM